MRVLHRSRFTSVFGRRNSLSSHVIEFQAAAAHDVCDNRSTTVRKSLILKRRDAEWSKEHAWKAARWSSVETYRITFSAVVSTT